MDRWAAAEQDVLNQLLGMPFNGMVDGATPLNLVTPGDFLEVTTGDAAYQDKNFPKDWMPWDITLQNQVPSYSAQMIVLFI